ncbi:protein NATD1 isoform X1 [Notamacropus eugenii]|uniref:protein NATD1 isoform X1 n=1 Tax=Notamacropus eugenii TaxID=9315 RepID=UPI003B686006
MAHSAQLNILEQNCPIQVEHDRKRRQFTVKLNGCHDRAVLLYEYVGKRIVDLQHTEVPDAYRGRGIAKHLAKTIKRLFTKEWQVLKPSHHSGVNPASVDIIEAIHSPEVKPLAEPYQIIIWKGTGQGDASSPEPSLAAPETLIWELGVFLIRKIAWRSAVNASAMKFFCG